MNFVVSSPQPVAGATGNNLRVQLPAAGRVALLHPTLSARTGPPAPFAAGRPQPWVADQSRHRAQCRAACQGKTF